MHWPFIVLRKRTKKTYRQFPYGSPTTQTEAIIADLLAVQRRNAQGQGVMPRLTGSN
jgi:hypothetical protein